MKISTLLAITALGVSLAACGNSLETWAQLDERCPPEDQVQGMGLSFGGAGATVCKDDATAGVTSGGVHFPGATGTTFPSGMNGTLGR